MRILLLALLSATVSMAAPAIRQVTVAEVDRMLAQSHSARDAALAKDLAGLELTERVSADRLARWQAQLPGPKSGQALVMLADETAFLDLPSDEREDGHVPGPDAQRQIMARTLEYVSRTVPRLPNFIATRQTTRFVELPEGSQIANTNTTSAPPVPMRFIDKLTSIVTYRDGQEIVESARGKQQMQPGPQKMIGVGDGLVTAGVFGPILGIVVMDAAHGQLDWGGWEQESGTRRAVFRYSVPGKQSHFQVDWCCFTSKTSPTEYSLVPFTKFPGYEGEIVVDPGTGAILRLTLHADLGPEDPIAQSEIAVEYGPVEIGGIQYICPLHSTSSSLAPVQLESNPHMAPSGPGPKRRSINDTRFSDYHIFRAETRILTGDDAPPEAAPPAAIPPH